jgi:perosamine synthetase
MSWFVFVVRLSDAYGQADRDEILGRLAEQGIGCSNYFAPIHLQPFYVESFGYGGGDFPACEAVAARTIALPFHHELAEDDVDFVCQTLRSLL